MTDTELEKAIALIKGELAKMEQAVEDDSRYESLRGNRYNAVEALGTFKPIAQQLLLLME